MPACRRPRWPARWAGARRSAAEQLDLSAGVSSALAAVVVVGFGAYALAQRQKAPPLVHLAAGIIPLLPGLTIYRGLLRLAEGDILNGLVTLGNALAVMLALAAVMILGEFLAQSTRRDVPRFERRLAGQRLAGPLRRSAPRRDYDQADQGPDEGS